MIDKVITLAAIFGITTCEVAAALSGIDGTTLGIAIAAIAGLAGYKVKVYKIKKSRGKRR